jgi:ribonucleoside-triphosphate reductase
MNMHIKKYPELKKEIKEVYDNYVIPKKVLPSMRSMQFAGKPIEVAPNRVYNCAYMPIDHADAFSECMFLLIGWHWCWVFSSGNIMLRNFQKLAKPNH